MSEFSRRDVLLGAGALAGASVLTGQPAVAGADDTVSIGEGTNMSAHLSPDGEHVAIDLVTAIWTVPATGGEARRLTGDDMDATLPTWSPDGRTLVIQAYRDGNYNLYTIHATGAGSRQITHGPSDQ